MFLAMYSANWVVSPDSPDTAITSLDKICEHLTCLLIDCKCSYLLTELLNQNLSDRLKNLFWSLFITMIDLCRSLVISIETEIKMLPGIGLIRSDHDKVVKLHPYQTLHLALWNTRNICFWNALKYLSATFLGLQSQPIEHNLQCFHSHK